MLSTNNAMHAMLLKLTKSDFAACNYSTKDEQRLADEALGEPL